MCNKKMRDYLYNEDDPGLITKKFWSLKSNSKSSRLPKAMHLDDTFLNKPSEKAELFNKKGSKAYFTYMPGHETL